MKDIQNLVFQANHEFLQLVIKCIKFWTYQLVNHHFIEFFSHNSWQVRMIKCKTSLRNQCPWLWFKTHATIDGKTLTTAS
jgi:hypothetical protein